MSEAALTFRIFGQSCVVILPPSLDVPPANDVQASGIGVAQRAQESRFERPEEPRVHGAPDLTVAGAGQTAPAVPPARPSEIVLRAPPNP
jgi:hypothetical protein